MLNDDGSHTRIIYSCMKLQVGFKHDAGVFILLNDILKVITDTRVDFFQPIDLAYQEDAVQTC